MSKNILIGSLILIVILAGCVTYFLTHHNRKSSQIANLLPTVTPSNNLFNSIADAIAKKITLSCDFTDDAGRHIVSYLKNGNIRADFTGKTEQDSGSVIFKDGKIYFWNNSMAVMMNMPTTTVTPGVGQSQTNPAEVMSAMEKYKQYCKQSNIDDSEFSPPADKNFTDASKMMMQPSGMLSGSQAAPSNYQQYMNQYQQYMQK